MIEPEPDRNKIIEHAQWLGRQLGLTLQRMDEALERLKALGPLEPPKPWPPKRRKKR